MKHLFVAYWHIVFFLELEATQAYGEEEEDTPALSLEERVENSYSSTSTQDSSLVTPAAVLRIPNMLKRTPAKSAMRDTAGTHHPEKQQQHVAFAQVQFW